VYRAQRVRTKIVAYGARNFIYSVILYTAMGLFQRFFIIESVCIPVQIVDRHVPENRFVTPSRGDTAQARLLDVRRILRVWERRNRSC